MNLSGLGSLMKNAGKIKEMMEQNAEELKQMKVKGEAAGGDITVEILGTKEVTNVNIDNNIFKEDKEIVEELLCAAINDALTKIEAITKEKMSGIGNMFGVDLPEDFK
jgi:nucleoid-associated protein EbfC